MPGEFYIANALADRDVLLRIDYDTNSVAEVTVGVVSCRWIYTSWVNGYVVNNCVVVLRGQLIL